MEDKCSVSGTVMQVLGTPGSYRVQALTPSFKCPMAILERRGVVDMCEMDVLEYAVLNVRVCTMCRAMVKEHGCMVSWVAVNAQDA